MTLAQLGRIFKGFQTETGIKTAYYQFSEGSLPQGAPYLVYFIPNHDDFIADNSNHVKVAVLRVELYTNFKDFTTEGLVEAILPGPYSKETTYIDSERIYETIYETEVIING